MLQPSTLLNIFLGFVIFLALASWIGLVILLPASKYTVPIMMYHHISEKDFGPDSVTPENFRWHMEYLKKKRYRVIGVEELVEKMARGERIPKKTVALAFDDGYRDNYTYAFPILKEFQYPAIFFVAPGSLAVNGFMSWDQIREIKSAGFTFGSHGMNQIYLPSLSSEKLRQEIFESKRALEKELGVKVDYFAYPVGGFTDEVKTLAKQAGYKAAFSTNRGQDRFNRDLYAINRVRFSNADNTTLILWMKLSGYNNRFRKPKSPA